MPIFGLTDRQKSFLRLAKIKKGEKTEKGGMRDLDYFRLIFSDGCDDVERAFRGIYGEKPTRISMRLAFKNVNECWDAYYVCYEKGGLLAKAGSNEDGLYWVWYRDHQTKEVLVRNGQPVGVEGRRLMEKEIDITQPVYSYQNTKNETVPVYLEPEGRLTIVVPELATIDGKPRVGFFEFCPGSPRDIGTISSELAAIDLWAKQVGKDITGIPMVLTRRKEMVTKNIKGVLSQGPSWVVHIEVAGEWGGKALEFMQMKALPEIVDAEEVTEFVDEDPDITPSHPFPASVVPAPAHDEWWDNPVPESVVPPSEKQEKSPEPVHEPHDSPLLSGNESKKEEKKAERPYAPEVFRDRLQKVIAKIPDAYAKDGIELIATDHERKVLASCLDSIFGDKGISRYPTCTWLTGHGSTADMTDAEIKAFFQVMGIKNDVHHPAQFNDPPSAVSIQELKQVYQEALKDKQ